MADGSSQPIDTLQVGDQVADSKPGGHGTEKHRVDRVIVTHTDHDFVDLTVTTTKASRSRRLPAGVAGPVVPAAAHATATLTTTTHHPFWDVTTHTWTQAASLHPGDTLQTPTGRAQVVALHLYTATQTTYDLTIHRLHTYYVKAGATPVLVHNCGYEAEATAAQGRAQDLEAQRGWSGGTTAVMGVRNVETGSVAIRIAINGDRAMPKSWELGAGEEFVRGAGHAEETIFNSLASNEEVVYGGTSRNVCQAICAKFMRPNSLTLGGRPFMGRADKTAFRTFWRPWRSRR
ncbi:hypothetical protein Athai_50410 [Actinocatenispora thailandica]|uniref:Intein C-terminal splicing domain-containing protein n=1 Tax=Actinocatenispora thailandica TaxID=227318 RepID=A0A7R7HZZ5_9ACTN|nr:polymorphic toxin-type HINT domain-containing protein [Actinocatenispora thailandica]BCJ37538.1 hypothetical protein Athai_50410 [Actinocatenispora thailandica]